jgi:hypothetical protein
LDPQEIQQLQMERNKVDPAHPLSIAEIEQLQNGGKAIPVSERERKLGKLNKPLSPAEKQQRINAEKAAALAANSPATRPPAPVKDANQAAIAQQQQPQQNVDPSTAPKFEFVGGDTYNYGEILESNEPTPHDFEFVNTGKSPLIIQEAHGSCGCTVPTFSKAPVLPGEKGIITVKYNSKGRAGVIAKDVIITSNAVPSPYTLHISGTVKGNPELYSTTPVQK